MPEKRTIEKAKSALRQGKSPTTAAGEFVHEEIDHVRQGKHGARSAKQAVAIGLSKARRAGIPLPPPKPGQSSEGTRRSAAAAYRAGQASKKRPASSKKRSQSTLRALQSEPKSTVSRTALSSRAKAAARRRPQPQRKTSARRVKT
jgi:hypothetical protein